ncbi:protein N-lysine methyltransferase METTL21A-like [Ciona intestinalis]
MIRIVKCLIIYLTMSNTAGSLEFEETEASCKAISNYAVVPYNTNSVLSEFYERSKNVTISKLGVTFNILQTWQEHGVAGVVWEAATVLADYLADNYDFHGRKVIELGAGTGVVGMAVAYLGGNVTVTDLQKFLPLLQENVDLNKNIIEKGGNGGNLTLSELKWGENLDRFEPGFYDFILGADIIYSEEEFQNLLETLAHLYGDDNNSKRKVILSAKRRYDHVETFIEILKTKFRSVDLVKSCEKTNVIIYECT